MGLEAGIVQHPPGVAAHREYFAGGNVMMGVEAEGFFLVGNAALVNYGLAIVFAGRLQLG